MHEWPLLIFSYLLQIAMGGTLGLLITIQVLKKSEVNTFQIARLPLIVFTAFSVIGSFAAFLHLGKPSNVFYVVMNIGDSWFSREIVCAGIFILLLLLTLIISMKMKKVHEVLLLITAIVGFLTVPVMGGIYSSTSIDAWNGLGTFATFYGTYFMAGALLVAVLVKNINVAVYKNLFRLAIIGLAVKVVLLPMHYAGVMESYTSGQLTLLWVGALISVVGLFGMGCVVLSKKGYNMTWIAIACLLVLIGEFITRYEFFTHAI